MPRFISHIEIDGEEIAVVVHYDYQPFEKMTWEYPGADEDVNVNSVECIGNGDDIACTDSQIEYFRLEILQHHKDEREAA